MRWTKAEREKKTDSDLVRLCTDTDEQGASQGQSSGDKSSENLHGGWFVTRRERPRKLGMFGRMKVRWLCSCIYANRPNLYESKVTIVVSASQRSRASPYGGLPAWRLVWWTTAWTTAWCTLCSLTQKRQVGLNMCGVAGLRTRCGVGSEHEFAPFGAAPAGSITPFGVGCFASARNLAYYFLLEPYHCFN